MLAWVTQVPVELAKNGLSVRDDHIPWYLDLQHASLATRNTYNDVVASPVLQLAGHIVIPAGSTACTIGNREEGIPLIDRLEGADMLRAAFPEHFFRNLLVNFGKI